MEYTRKISEFPLKYSGKYSVEEIAPEVIEGSWKPNTLIILEFNSELHVNRFLADSGVK
jgi:uncharacterized protein (DUF1330 family)